MVKSDLISLLKTFSKNEIKEFDKFLRSPYFTEGKNIRHKILYTYFCKLKKFYPEFSSSECSKEYIYNLLYPGKIYDDNKFRKLNSDLTSLAENFLVQLELEKDGFKKREYLLNNLSPRKLDKLFLKKADECRKFLEADNLNLYYNFNLQLLDILVNNFCIYRQELLSRYSLKKEADNFFLYFLSRSLEIYRNMTIDEELINLKYKPLFMNEVLDYLKQNPSLLDDNPLIAIHYYELMINISSDEQNYINLKSLKNKYEGRLDIFGKYNIYINLSAFCFKKIRNGYAGYRKELMNTDIEMMNKEILISSDFISYSYLISAVRNAARIKEFEKAEKFIEVYCEKLDPRHKEFAVNVARAEIFYEQKKYNMALDCLTKINIEYSREKQAVKNMIIKIYYETGSFENALSIIDSSRHILLKDKQIPEARKLSASNFLKFAAQAVNLKLNPDESRAKQVKNEIEKTGFFANKDWLLEKIKELSGKS